MSVKPMYLLAVDTYPFSGNKCKTELYNVWKSGFETDAVKEEDDWLVFDEVCANGIRLHKIRLHTIREYVVTRLDQEES